LASYLPFHFILEDINVFRRNPSFRVADPVISAYGPRAESTVNKLEGIIAIHGSQKAELEGRFIRSFVQARCTNIFLLPGLSSSKSVIVPFLDVALNFKKAVIGGTDLVSKMWMTRELYKKSIIKSGIYEVTVRPLHGECGKVLVRAHRD
jgi:hypothetical protein